MAVYVDDMYLYALGSFRGMRMSHLCADTTQELLEMVDTIGVSRHWIHHPGTPKEHFDIDVAKREAAINAGAVEITMREMGRFVRQRRQAQRIP